MEDNEIEDVANIWDQKLLSMDRRKVPRYLIIQTVLPVSREGRAVINTKLCNSPDVAQALYNTAFVPNTTKVSVFNKYLHMDETFMFEREGGWRHK